MSIMTPDLEKRLNAIPWCATQDQGFDAKAQLVCSALGSAGIWIVTEGMKMPWGDWVFWGFHQISSNEWGYVTLNELEELETVYGIKLSVNRNPSGTVRQYMRSF